MMFSKESLPEPQAAAGGLLLCLSIGGFYVLDNSAAITLYGGGRFYNFAVRPALWLGLAYLAHSFPEMGCKAKQRQRELLNAWAFIFAALMIIISVLAGLYEGFGASPYDRSPLGLFGNLWVAGTMLIARELVRCQLVRIFAKKGSFLLFLLIALFLAAASLPFKEYLRLTECRDYMGIVQFAARTFVPEAAKNLLAVHFAYLGGPLPGMIYFGLLQGFHWLSPVLPNLKWLTASLIGILCPVFSLSVLEQIHENEIKRSKRRNKKEEGIWGWMLTSLASIGIVWFAVGLFPVYPSVIASASMEPVIMTGDVILVSKDVDKMNLKAGDVIQFKSEDILISHRIIGVYGNEDQRRYQTKGDNNTAEDSELIAPEKIRGRIIKVIPKLGWPTLLLKSKKEIPLERIRF